MSARLMQVEQDAGRDGILPTHLFPLVKVSDSEWDSKKR